LSKRRYTAPNFVQIGSGVLQMWVVKYYVWAAHPRCINSDMGNRTQWIWRSCTNLYTALYLPLFCSIRPTRTHLPGQRDPINEQ